MKSILVFYADPFFVSFNSRFCSPENSTLLPCRAASRLSKRPTARCQTKGELNFLSTLIAEGSLQRLMWLSPTETLIAKVSSQNLVRSSTTRIVSRYMTLFLVLNHEIVRFYNGLLKAKTITIDDITLPVIASTICKNASTLRM
jgi:hypothetical protein